MSEQVHRPFYTERELLSQLPLSRRSVFELRRNGKLPFIRVGRKILYHAGTVEQALLRLQHGPVQRLVMLVALGGAVAALAPVTWLAWRVGAVHYRLRTRLEHWRTRR